jgi:hypothetical protein
LTRRPASSGAWGRLAFRYFGSHGQGVRRVTRDAGNEHLTFFGWDVRTFSLPAS